MIDKEIFAFSAYHIVPSHAIEKHWTIVQCLENVARPKEFESPTFRLGETIIPFF